MAKQNVYGGLFKDPPYISTDEDPQKTDLYVKMEPVPSRYLGKTMLASHPRSGKLPDVYFGGTYLTLASVDQNGGKPIEVYMDPGKVALREAAVSKAKNVDRQVFRLTSFPAVSSGCGDSYGCFQANPYGGEEPSGEVRSLKRSGATEEEKHKPALPNIKTNPGKKGTYGFPGLLLEKYNSSSTWSQSGTAVDSVLKEGRGATDGSGASNGIAAPPFKVHAVTQAYLDGKPATGVSAVYDSAAPTDAASGSAIKHRAKSTKSQQHAIQPLQHEKAFVSASYTHNGESGYLSKFPNSWIDPSTLQQAQRKRESGGKTSKKSASKWGLTQTKPIGGVWKPTSQGQTSIVQSCLRRFY